MHSPVLFVIVGASASGKGVLLRSVRDMGERHIVVIPKATTRPRKTTDGDELVFFAEFPFPRKYNIVYGNYRNRYGISTRDIWRVLRSGKHAFLICSNFASRDEHANIIPGLHDAIPRLYRLFGPLVRLVYLHSEVTPAKSEEHQWQIAAEDERETGVRTRKIKTVRRYYVDNIQFFDHVLLNVAFPEDLSDQIFRLVLHYSRQLQ